MTSKSLRSEIKLPIHDFQQNSYFSVICITIDKNSNGKRIML